jgi:hypothetical protein
MINNVEENIYDLAIEQFNKNNKVQLEIEFEERETIANGFLFDKLVKFNYQKKNLLYYVEIKYNINNAVIALLLQRKKNLKHPILLITRYVNNIKAEELKKNGIQFLDTAGNAYINYRTIYIFVKGNKPPGIYYKNKKHRAFETAGLKIIFALLCKPDLIKKPYRHIAEKTDVALGTVGLVINDLIGLGFLIKMGNKGRQLLKKKKLFDRWCVEYNEKLRPKLLINKFTGPKDWWIHKKLNPEYTQWGGEVAANKLINHIKPGEIIIYTNYKMYKNLIIENRLRKDTDGEITILEKFWKLGENDEPMDVVNPILIYADLINIENQRTIETARIIYEKYIDRRIREN